ncbi:MAG TPA: hypothetical protein VJV79_00395 [Polyangiaceae bacterium]|nr:hypothetical protein [Polyangiaceae bacterium]
MIQPRTARADLRGSSVGLAGSGAGVAGNASSWAGLGNIGTGSVACSGVSGGSCAAGSVCCVRFTGAANTCAGSYAAYALMAYRSVATIRAIVPGKSVARKDPVDLPPQTHNGSGCKPACDPTSDRIICTTTADCESTGACMPSGTLMACY